MSDKKVAIHKDCQYILKPCLVCGIITKRKKFCSIKCRQIDDKQEDFSKLTYFKKGQIPWNKDKKYTQEERAGWKSSKGSHWKLEARIKKSDVLKDFYKEHKIKDLRPNFYKPRKGFYRGCQYCKILFYVTQNERKQFCSYKCYWNTKRGISNPEHSERLKKLYQLNPDKHPNKASAKNSQYGTRCEKLLSLIFEQLKIKYIPQYYVEGKFGDFLLPDYNIIIEADGIYWHRNDTEENREKRDSIFQKSGFSVIHVTDAEINQNQLNKVGALIPEIIVEHSIFEELKRQAKDFTGYVYKKRKRNKKEVIKIGT